MCRSHGQIGSSSECYSAEVKASANNAVFELIGYEKFCPLEEGT